MFSPGRSLTLPVTQDPADLCAALFPNGNVVWFDRGFDALKGRSILGTGTRTLTASGAQGTVCVDGVRRPGRIFDSLRDQAHGAPASDEFPFGWAGWIGYESGVAGLGLSVAEDDGDDSAFVLLDRVVVIDHVAGSVTVAVSDDALTPWLAWAAETVSNAHGAAERYSTDHPVSQSGSRVVWRHSDAEYRQLIGACHDAIRAGDVYQVCLTNLATAHSDADPLTVALRLRRASPSHHSGFLRIGNHHLVSSSPEQFIRLNTDGLIRTEPIKGTRPRGASAAIDELLRCELVTSDKERAENLMIVDLMRNDLARVCTLGSVAVPRLFEVESYAQVHQLVSTIEGKLRSDLGAAEAVAACFPAGSMTGAPKLAAIDLLHRLEAGARGVYAGCFGLFACDGSADLAMTIRSAHFSDGYCRVGSGGGITALSQPDDEIAEFHLKADAVSRAAGLAE